jgi:hypothetical protein
MKRSSFFNKVLTYKVMFYVFTLASAVVFIPKIILADYNNYKIFVSAFSILKHHDNPYLPHPEYYWDLYRYTPTFGILMAPFSFLPDAVGVLLWNSLNAVVLVFGMKAVFKNDERTGCIALAIIFIEFTTAAQNCQSNSLVAGLMLLSFASLRDNQNSKASFYSILNLFVKIYGFAIAALYWVYPKKKEYLIGSAIFFIAFFCVPLLFISPQELKQNYISEFSSVAEHATGLSMMSFVSSLLKTKFPFLYMQVPALFLLLLPMLFSAAHHTEKIKYLLVSSILIFVVSFNQASESATYIIGVVGAALWYVQAEKNKLNHTLLILLMAFTCLAPTDIYPTFIRQHFFEAYKIKAVPLFIIWVKVQIEVWVLIASAPSKEKINPIAV